MSTIFGALTGNVQARIDAADAAKKQVFLYRDILSKLFDWGLPTIDTDFKTILGRYGISVAAPTIEFGSGEPLVGGRGVETFSNEMFRHAISSEIDADTRRKILKILDSRSLIKDAEKKRQLVEIMFGNVKERVDGVYAKLFLVAMGMLSNKGRFEYTDDNNPEGAVRGVVEQAFKNSASVTKDWTKPNASDVDVFSDIMGLIHSFPNLQFDRILLSPGRLAYILNNSNLRKAVFGNDKASTPLLLANLNNFMRQNELPEFVPIRSVVRVQSPTAPGRVKDITAFNDKNLVFIPAGKIGVIENAFTDDELEPSDGVAYSKVDRVVISQWSTGRKEGGSNTDYIAAETIAQPVFTAADGMATLTVES